MVEHLDHVEGAEIGSRTMRLTFLLTRKFGSVESASGR
jgi:hypothetical protein